MKKYLLLFFSIVFALANGCKKDTGYLIKAAAGNTNNGTGSSSGSTGGTGGSGNDTYQPVTPNSYWKYRNGSDSSIYVMSSATASFNGSTYYLLNLTSNLYSGTQSGYFYPGTNHYYSQRSSSLVYGITVDMVYLNDVLPAGSSWTSKITDSGTINGVPARTVSTILETGISRTVLGKLYTSVIHTKVDLQYDFGNGFASYGIYEFYVAKNIGVIENFASLPGFATSPTYLYSYSIK